MNEPLNSVFVVDFIPLGDTLQLNQAYCIFFVILLLLFSLDNIKDSLAKDVKLTLLMMISPVVFFAQAVAAAYFGVYTF